MEYKTIKDLGDLNGKVVMLRADLNVPVDENLKVADQMTWVQSMNRIRSRAEEIILHEMIYEEEAICESLKSSGTAILTRRNMALRSVRSIGNCIGWLIETKPISAPP